MSHAETSELLAEVQALIREREEEGGPERPSDYFFIQRALPDGTIHESVTTLDLKGQNVNVKVENGGYRKM